MNLTTITVQPDGTVDVTTTLVDGTTETITGLGQIDYAFAWSHLKLRANDRRRRY